MAQIADTKRTERAGVNAFRALMESARHIVQEIDGGNDYGEDCYLSLTNAGRRTGDIVSVQVKSGVKYRRSSGYAIPCRDHVDDWSRSRIPVVGVVYDPELRKLFWVNLSEYLRAALDEGRRPRSVPVREDAVLDKTSLADFTVGIAAYIARNDVVRYVRSGFTRSILAHFARRRIAGEDRPVPVGGKPDHAAARSIAFMERHESKFAKAAIAALALIIAVLWTVMAPGLAKGADRTNNDGWLWVVVYFGFLSTLIWHGWRDKTRFGRGLRYFHHVLLFLGWFVALYEQGQKFFFINPVVEALFYGVVVTCGQFGLLLIGTYYTQREIARRRRLKAAYGTDDATEIAGIADADGA